MIRKLLTAFFTLCFLVSFGQTFNVSGNVVAVEDDLPIPGVNILIKNTSQGVVTDFDGNFTFDDVPAGATLVFSYVGFQTQELVISNGDFLNVLLETDVAQLDEVVVIGYGTQRKKEITGAVGIVSSETIEELKPTRVEQALQGQVAGVQINSNSGSPGSGSTISIRGISTNGDSRPLILVDGNVIEDLSTINPNDIESVNVLKDATAGIYGVRAANGVILIKTKTGRKNTELSVEYSGYAGFQETTRRIPTLNATEYALIVNEAFAASGQSPIFPDVSGLGIGTDWQDEVFENALILDHSITLKGGKENSTYSFGSSFLTQNGIVGGGKSNFTRFTKRINYGLDFLEKFKLNTSIIYTHTNRQALSEGGIGSVLFNALNMDPTVGRYGRALGHQGIGLGGEVINPISQMKSSYNRGKVDKVSGTAGVSYNFLDKFTAQSNIQANWARTNQFVFSPVVDFAVEGNSDTVFDRELSEVFFGENIFKDYTFDAFVNYEDSFNDSHNLKVLLGMSVFQTTGEFTGNRGFNIPDNMVQNATLELASDVQDIFQELGYNPTFDSRLLSYFARLQYDYKGKYLLSAVIRRDGSTKFGPENKFGYFPSGSLGWIISNEDFLADSNTINFLKLRASYGILGNDRIPDFRYVSLLNGEGTYVLDNELEFGTALGAVANPEIRWEKQKTFDIGLDIKLLNNKIDITTDYFKRETEDLLVVPEVSGLLGTAAPGSGPPVVNAGSVENSGIEFSIGYNDKIGEDFGFNIRYNLTALDNEVLSVSGDDDFLAGGQFGIGQEPPSRMEAGFPIGYFRGYTTDGIFQNQSEIDNYPTINNMVQPGDLRFVDLNSDGVIDDDDKSYIGDPIPDATMGLNIRLDYRNFDLGAYAYASLGNEIVRNYERNQQLTNRTVHILDRWTGEGTSNTVPRVTNGANSNNLFSDYFVEDGSFVRIQNIQIGYTFSEKTLESLNLDKLRLYVSSNNVYTFTKYRGYDPTASSGVPIGGGIDPGFYPSARTFIFGVNLKF